MKIVLMTIGLPFSGKSSLAAEYRKKGWQIIERDKILAQVINSQEFQAQTQDYMSANENLPEECLFEFKNRLAIEMLNKELQKIILDSDNDNIFYDGTNLQKASRAGVLELKQSGVEVNGVFLDVPINEIIDRAKKVYEEDEPTGEFNEKAIFSLQRMYEMFEEPETSEGFNKLERLKQIEHETKYDIKLKNQ
ncbi:AAA family ATPase [Patescibacteria group bacterium]